MEEPKAGRGVPATGQEMQRRLQDKDESLAKQGLCKPGDLINRIVQAGKKAGLNPDLSTWSGPDIQLAINETKVFEAQFKKPVQKEVA